MATEIHKALLQMPARAGTVMPELVTYFGKDTDGMMRFLRAFSGCTLLIPDPRMLAELERDVELALALQRDESPPVRVALCRRYKVTPMHLKQVHLAAFGRELPDPPHNGTIQGRVTAAAHVLLEVSPGNDRIVRDLFGLNNQQIKAAKELAATGAQE